MPRVQGRTKNGEPPRTRTLMSVYPHQWAKDVIGTSTVPFNKSIECWAQVLAWAAVENESVLTEKDFQFLFDVCSGFSFDPRHPAPGKQIGMLLKAPSWGERLKGFPKLVGIVERMDFVHAWAVLWAIQYAIDHTGAKDWWKLEARKAP